MSIIFNITILAILGLFSGFYAYAEEAVKIENDDNDKSEINLIQKNKVIATEANNNKDKEEQTFIPSEQLSEDKIIDFPTNI